MFNLICGIKIFRKPRKTFTRTGIEGNYWLIVSELVSDYVLTDFPTEVFKQKTGCSLNLILLSICLTLSTCARVLHFLSTK